MKARLVIPILAIVGLASGLAAAFFPAEYQSTASVQIGYGHLINDRQVLLALAESDGVAREAAKAIGTPFHFGERRVQAQLVTDQILAITVQEPGAVLAEREAHAVADAFLGYLASRIRDPHGEASSYVLDVPHVGTPVRTLGAFTAMGLIGLAAGLLLALLVLGIGRISGPRMRPATA